MKTFVYHLAQQTIRTAASPDMPLLIQRHY